MTISKQGECLMRNRILVVDDEPAISELICMNLQITGYDCDSALDSNAALESLSKMQYDLVLLDIMLPGMDGFELIEHINARNVPVIYLSAKNAVTDKVRGLRLGAEDYIVKPFDALELLVRVEKVLMRHQKVSDVLNLDNVQINIPCLLYTSPSPRD